MKLSTNDGAFVFNLQHGKATVSLNTKKFSGHITIDNLPPKLNRLQERLCDIAGLVENVAGDIRKSLEEDDHGEDRGDSGQPTES